jgi:predicted ribosomally synthesized peptide with SipW-like signal peptide
MKKVIIGLLMICVVAGLVTVGTWAAFRDVETSTDNIFVAGSMDLKVDGEDDPIIAYFDTEDCVKPGDSGEVTITLSNVGCVDGLLDLHITITESDENIAVEPELNAGDVEDDLGNNMDGELAANMDMKITADLDGDGTFETVVAEGKVSEIACTNYVYGALDAEDSIELKIEWWVESTVGNLIMTDTLMFDIEFSLDQAMEACLTVIGIQQPEAVQECELVDIAVDVKNTGGVAGECDLIVTVTDPTGYVIGTATVPTGMVEPLETVKVPVFDDLHIPVTDPPIATPYIVTVSVIDCCTGEEVICEIAVTDPPALHVVDIVQPTTAFWCEELIVEVYVHNDGGKPGECIVMAGIADLEGNPLIAPVQVATPVIAVCETVVIPVNLGHVDEAWPPMIVVGAGSCADIDPYVCLPPINVAPPPMVPGVGSYWEYEVNYPPGSTETTIMTATLAARGLGDPLPAGQCLNPPTGQGPYYQLSWNDVSTCTCQATGGCLYDGTDSPLRTLSGGTMAFILMGSDSYAREANLVGMWGLAPVCAWTASPAMSNVAMTLEVLTDGYNLVSGTYIGYPYSVGDKWTYTSTADTYIASFGLCASALGPLPPSLVTDEVVAVGVTNPSGGYADCVQIDSYSVAQKDDDGDGLYGEDPVDGVDNDGDTVTDEDPVETDPTLIDDDGDSLVNEDPVDGGVDNDGDTLIDEDDVNVKCTSTTWWSPTVMGMVEASDPCTYDQAEQRILINYSLVP